MKRIARGYKYSRSFSALKEVPAKKLKLIGAIGVEYTGIERLVDYILKTLLFLDPEETQVASSINGMDGKLRIIKALTKASADLSGEPAALIADVMGEVGRLKTYRDAVAHADIHDPKADIAVTHIKHGRLYEVDISVAALTALCERLYELSDELVYACRVVQRHSPNWELVPLNDPNEVRESQTWPEHLEGLRWRQSKRKALPPMPEFPQEPEDQEG